ncbi:hypothetical protein MKX79_03890 [Viridibacillus sp. FSL R5-0468]
MMQFFSDYINLTPGQHLTKYYLFWVMFVAVMFAVIFFLERKEGKNAV